MSSPLVSDDVQYNSFVERLLRIDRMDALKDTQAYVDAPTTWVTLTDDELVERLRAGSLMWADINEAPELCYLIDGDGSEHDVDPDQAQRLYAAGVIELPMPELEWEFSFHWHLRS